GLIADKARRDRTAPTTQRTAPVIEMTRTRRDPSCSRSYGIEVRFQRAAWNPAGVRPGTGPINRGLFIGLRLVRLRACSVFRHSEALALPPAAPISRF